MVVPRVLLSCHYIASELEEMEREDNFRLKRFKQLMEKRKRLKNAALPKLKEIEEPPLVIVKEKGRVPVKKIVSPVNNSESEPDKSLKLFDDTSSNSGVPKEDLKIQQPLVEQSVAQATVDLIKTLSVHSKHGSNRNKTLGTVGSPKASSVSKFVCQAWQTKDDHKPSVILKTSAPEVQCPCQKKRDSQTSTENLKASLSVVGKGDASPQIKSSGPSCTLLAPPDLEISCLSEKNKEVSQCTECLIPAYSLYGKEKPPSSKLKILPASEKPNLDQNNKVRIKSTENLKPISPVMGEGQLTQSRKTICSSCKTISLDPMENEVEDSQLTKSLKQAYSLYGKENLLDVNPWVKSMLCSSCKSKISVKGEETTCDKSVVPLSQSETSTVDSVCSKCRNKNTVSRKYRSIKHESANANDFVCSSCTQKITSASVRECVVCHKKEPPENLMQKPSIRDKIGQTISHMLGLVCDSCHKKLDTCTRKESLTQPKFVKTDNYITHIPHMMCESCHKKRGTWNIPSRSVGSTQSTESIEKLITIIDNFAKVIDKYKPQGGVPKSSGDLMCALRKVKSEIIGSQKISKSIKTNSGNDLFKDTSKKNVCGADKNKMYVTADDMKTGKDDINITVGKNVMNITKSGNFKSNKKDKVDYKSLSDSILKTNFDGLSINIKMGKTVDRKKSNNSESSQKVCSCGQLTRKSDTQLYSGSSQMYASSNNTQSLGSIIYVGSSKPSLREINKSHSCADITQISRSVDTMQSLGLNDNVKIQKSDSHLNVTGKKKTTDDKNVCKNCKKTENKKGDNCSIKVIVKGEEHKVSLSTSIMSVLNKLLLSNDDENKDCEDTKSISEQESKKVGSSSKISTKSSEICQKYKKAKSMGTQVNLCVKASEDNICCKKKLLSKNLLTQCKKSLPSFSKPSRKTSSYSFDGKSSSGTSLTKCSMCRKKRGTTDVGTSTRRSDRYDVRDLAQLSNNKHSKISQ